MAYKDGVRWASETVRTAGRARRVRVLHETSADVPPAEAGNLVFYSAVVTDWRGGLVPGADNLLKFSVKGPGEIVAVDNGDPTSHVPFYSHEMPAFHGLCAVIVRRTGPGRIRLKASLH